MPWFDVIEEDLAVNLPHKFKFERAGCFVENNLKTQYLNQPTILPTLQGHSY